MEMMVKGRLYPGDAKIEEIKGRNNFEQQQGIVVKIPQTAKTPSPSTFELCMAQSGGLDTLPATCLTHLSSCPPLYF